MRIPGPFPDENLTSIISRFQLIYGMTEIELKRHILGNKHVSGKLSRRNMLIIIDYFSRLFGMSSTTFISNHTLVPLYSPFVNGASEGYVKKRILPNLLLQQHYPNFCMKCVSEDIKHFGVAYWHRTHQANGVVTCHRHGEVIHMHPVSNKALGFGLQIPTPWRTDIVLDFTEYTEEIFKYSKWPSISNAEKQQFSKDQRKFSNDYSKLTFDLLNNDIGGIRNGMLGKVYRQRLRSLGIIDPETGYSRYDAIRYLHRLGEIDVQQWLPMGSTLSSDDLFAKLLGLVADLISDGYIYNIRYNPSLHLMIIRTLFDSFSDWKESVSEHRTDNQIVNYFYSEYGDKNSLF
ncbi:MAG: TniQ family protein [Candidatus Thiodiazotropha endolucinida]|nr:TniQ family protein [Candidatus Thiodiazotropha taylori]MCG8052884.1 TniQ family protein [Candidatus Thiodiazotropha taylori]MCW4314704.1 TniQ family protein [Candidatus Thiodiazotropha taylori]MCW4320241.1 TniQ family protein [Candidatus Thiodiazotropha taylori]